MLHATSKYFGEQDDRHGGKLHWPGVNGLPFRGEAAPNLKKRELAQLPTVATAHHRLFDLGDEEQSKIYAWVRDRIKNGLFVCDFVERHWDIEAKKYWVYIEWSQLYTQLPNNIELGSNGNGSPNYFTLRSPD